jgi:hypothetical protein
LTLCMSRAGTCHLRSKRGIRVTVAWSEVR